MAIDCFFECLAINHSLVIKTNVRQPYVKLAEHQKDNKKYFLVEYRETANLRNLVMSVHRLENKKC